MICKYTLSSGIMANGTEAPAVTSVELQYSEAHLTLETILAQPMTAQSRMRIEAFPQTVRPNVLKICVNQWHIRTLPRILYTAHTCLWKGFHEARKIEKWWGRLIHQCRYMSLRQFHPAQWNPEEGSHQGSCPLGLPKRGLHFRNLKAAHIAARILWPREWKMLLDGEWGINLACLFS